MTDQAFSIGNLLALIAWLALSVSLFAPSLRRFIWPASGILLPAAFGVAYVALIASAWGSSGGFGSIADVRALFANDAALTAGWFHYLAFDLFVGTWIARDGTGRGIPGLLLVPCLALTFLFGPAGLLLYLILRTVMPAKAA